MFPTTSYAHIEAYPLNESRLFVDLRSPSEHRDATIPGSINLPVLDDEERKQVGILYARGLIDEAKQLGIDAMSAKLPHYFAKLLEWSHAYDHLILFCSRGGFRSAAIFNLLRSLYVKVERLDQGYKGYRTHILNNLPSLVDQIDFAVLDGLTGCGKTEILASLQDSGWDVLDLEGLANHRGSLLGHVGLGTQPSQRQFESMIYDTLIHRKSDYLFVEGESHKIGNVYIPHYLYAKMAEANRFTITSPLTHRIRRIHDEYVTGNDEDILKGLNALKHYVSPEKLDHMISLVQSGDYDQVIENLMVRYYDPKYAFKHRNPLATFDNVNSKATAEDLIKWLDDHFKL